MEPFSHGLLGELGKLSASGAQKKRDVIVVTMVSCPVFNRRGMALELTERINAITAPD